MTGDILLYMGSGIIFLWGVGHLMPTKNIVKGFGELTPDNRRIITMEWIAEGLTLCFIGVLVFATTLWGGFGDAFRDVVVRLSAGMLIVMAVVSAFTGARTSILPMKLCPFIKTLVAGLFVVGSVV
jgi:hypothetical protein